MRSETSIIDEGEWESITRPIFLLLSHVQSTTVRLRPQQWSRPSVVSLPHRKANRWDLVRIFSTVEATC